MESGTPEWISAISSVVMTGAVILAFLQTRILRQQVALLEGQVKGAEKQAEQVASQTSLLAQRNEKLYEQMMHDHERSRRENAANVISQFVRSLRRSASDTRRLVETLDEKQARALYKFEELSLQSDLEDLVRSCLAQSGLPITPKSQTITLSKSAVTEIRWQAMEYLNLLESALLAGHYGIADKEMMESEFAYLVDDTEGRNAMELFRKVCGGPQAFPCIEAFVTKIRQQASAPSARGPIASPGAD